MGDSDGDAPPPFPEAFIRPAAQPSPEEEFYRCVLSAEPADHYHALFMVRRNAGLYTTCLPNLHSFFTRCLLSTDRLFPLMTRDAFVALAAHIRTNGEMRTMHALFSPLVRLIIASEQDLPAERVEGSSGLRTLNELAAVLPDVMRLHVDALISLCRETIHRPEKDEAARSDAINLLAKLSEIAPQSIPARLLPLIVDSCLEMMSLVDEDKMTAWRAGTRDASGLSDDVILGGDCFRRIVYSLRETSIVAVTLEMAASLLQDAADWGRRLAGVSALEIVGTTGRIVMIEEIVNSVVPALKDPHPRVREEVFTLFSFMSVNFGPVLTSACLQGVVPVLISAVVDTTIPARVLCEAADALNSFIRDCPELLSSYIDKLLTLITRSLDETARSGSIDEWKAVLVCDQLSTVEILAWATYVTKDDYVIRSTDPKRVRDALGLTPDRMATIYARLIGSLKGILKSSHDSFRPILAGTAKCISRLSDCIGKAKFSEDAAEILSACAARLPQLRGTDCKLFLRSVGEICELLGADCGPLLPLLMPPLMGIARCAARVPGSTLDEWNQQVACCQEAVLFIKELSIALGAAFAPFVAELSTVLLDNMKTSNLDKLGLYHLLACIAHEGMAAMRALWLAHGPEMKFAIKRKKQCGWYLVCVLNICIQKLGPQGVSTTEVREVGETIREVLHTIVLTGVRRDSNGDSTDEEMLLLNISSLVSDLFKEFGANCFGTVHNLIPAVFASGMCRTLWGVRLIGSFLREAPEMAFIYHEDIGALLLTSLDDDYPKIRRSASYTIGVVAFMKRPEWTPFTAQSLVPLSEMVARPYARATEYCILATENAIAAVAKIIKHCDGIDASQVVPSFIDWLLLHGIREDKEESQHVYGVLADLIEAQHPLIMGQKNGNYVKLSKIITQAMYREAFEVTEETEEAQRVKKRLVIILKDMKLADEPFFHGCLEAARLEEIEKDVLNKILS